MKKALIIFNFLLFSYSLLNAQNYFMAYKNGEKSFVSQDYDNAIIEFTKVLESKSDHDRALNYRGLSYEAVNELEKAVLDFQKAISTKTKEADYYSNLGRVYFKLNKFNEADVELSKAIDYDKKKIEAYEYKTLTLIALKKYTQAVENADDAIAKDKNSRNYYLKGVAQDSLMNYKDAAFSFGRAIFYSKESVDAHLGLAFSNFKMDLFDKALESCDKALSFDKENVDALLLRSKINIARNNSQQAIDDITKIITLYPEEASYYVKRGDIYQLLNQYQNAISDYSTAIRIDKDDYFLYYQRAKSYEALLDYKSAIKDYQTLKTLTPYDGKALKLYDEAKQRLYELNKESNNPKIVILAPSATTEGKMPIAKGVEKYLVKGQILDESNIDFIKVNGKDAIFSKDSINPKFEIEIELLGLKNVTISAFDIYQNSESWEYEIIETEVNAPIVKLMAPYASDDGTIYLDTDDPTLYVEGVINDESLIKRILIEGSTASFVIDKSNPNFSANINIMNKDGFKILAEDIYGNVTEKSYIINRENIALLGDNPMGKTWVIFIENSNYTTFASLDGPTKDVTMMKSAFAKYKIHNVIHKSNMTKSQLEKFFSIELRDLVRSNRVNSLLVWYAGHGKYINESGYWIPVDAKRDEEFTYFNINNLKAAMQSYSKFITHTLVITDACESGPSFYQAMRSGSKDRSCNDWQATKFKSSQVFSSAGYELAVDNSQFTKTFASTLSSNPNSCIPIETIVSKVSSAVEKSGASQKPKFGKIAGLEDENGTFFFIKK
ncbi:MAG: caspase family protein [Flavobacteriales bacterium]|nr:caspase family protein [Flavobacteriales bacterium]MCB9363225.1 caspase family protein [Flavobacteriales bacterium]